MSGAQGACNGSRGRAARARRPVRHGRPSGCQARAPRRAVMVMNTRGPWARGGAPHPPTSRGARGAGGAGGAPVFSFSSTGAWLDTRTRGARPARRGAAAGAARGVAGERGGRPAAARAAACQGSEGARVRAHAGHMQAASMVSAHARTREMARLGGARGLRTNARWRRNATRSTSAYRPHRACLSGRAPQHHGSASGLFRKLSRATIWVG